MILSLKNVTKSFTQGGQKIEVLKNLSLELEEGSSLAILGPSGSGKTTLLSLIAGLDTPNSGEIAVDQQYIHNMSEVDLTRFRAEKLGIVFQQFHLLPHLTAIENVSLPLDLLGHTHTEERAEEALTKVGLQKRLNHFPHQMSGGENQRVALARALVVKPRLLLADEPSGSLDNKTGEQVIDLLFELVKKERTTLVMVTHNEDLARRCQHQFRFGS